MKTKFYLKKKWICRIPQSKLCNYLTVFVILLVSCQSQEPIVQPELSVETAKDWFEKYTQEPAIDETLIATGRKDDTRNSHSFKRQLFWGKAKKLKGGKLPNGLRIPVWYENNMRFGKQALRELMIYKNKDGAIKADMVEILASRDYFKQKGKIDMNDFTGIITFHDWKKGFKGGVRYENGKRVGYLTEYSVKDAKTWKPKNITSTRTNCGGGYQYSYVENGELVIVWVEEPCYDMSYFWMMYNIDQYNSYYNQYLDAQYGCEVTSSCQNYDTNPSSETYYEPAPEPEPEFVVGGDDPYAKVIENIYDHLKCLDPAKPAKFTIYVDQPLPGTNYHVYALNDNGGIVGHSFLSIEQGGYIRTVGFYPKETAGPYNPEDPMQFKDNAGKGYDVSVSFNISATEMDSLLTYIKDKTPYLYDLNTFNCTNWVISACASMGMNLPGNPIVWKNGGGLSPGQFGEDMRNFTLPDRPLTISPPAQPGNAPENTGTCPY